MNPVVLHGGPCHGKSGLLVSDYPDHLELVLVLQDAPIAIMGPEAQVKVTLCRYAHGAGGVYNFSSRQFADMTLEEYRAYQAAEKVYAKVRALATDPRINEFLDGPPPENALPLDEAKAMKAKATAVWRQFMEEKGEPVGKWSDEKVWASCAGLLVVELEWADMGLAATIDGLRHTVFHLFGIELHQKLDDDGHPSAAPA